MFSWQIEEVRSRQILWFVLDGLMCLLFLSYRVISWHIFSWKWDPSHTLFLSWRRTVRCTKFGVNLTNLKRVIIPTTSSTSWRLTSVWRLLTVRSDYVHVTERRLDMGQVLVGNLLWRQIQYLVNNWNCLRQRIKRVSTQLRGIIK